MFSYELKTMIGESLIKIGGIMRKLDNWFYVLVMFVSLTLLISIVNDVVNFSELLVIQTKASVVSKDQEIESLRMSLNEAINEVKVLNNDLDILTTQYNENLEQIKTLEVIVYEKQMKTENEHITYSDRVVYDTSNDIRFNTGISRGDNLSRVISMKDMRTPSALTAYEINLFLEDTGLNGLGEAYIKAENESGVNAMFLVALSMIESGNGNSKLSKNKNNIFGYQAYDSDPYNSAKTFSSKEECIYEVASVISKKYLTEDGPYFGGGYTINHINKRYATDPDWDIKIISKMVAMNDFIINHQDIKYHNEINTVINTNSGGE